MKHQYFGDVNDYVKYGLLRALGEVAGLRVGVAWMLTPDDDRPDGSRTAYRRDPGWREHDPELYDRLARLATRPGARSVELFRRWDLVPGALDVDSPLPANADERAAWMAAALATLHACPLLFFDPDNGFEIESTPPGRRDSIRYLYWAEAAAAWGAGHSLLVYQHFPREDRDAFERRLRDLARRHLAGARVTVFRSAHVLFLLAARPEHADALGRAGDEVVRRWGARVSVTADAPAPDRAGDLAAVCEALARDGESGAREALAGRYPFVAPAGGSRATSELEALRVWLRDGFIDRYGGTRLVFPGTLLLLSALLPGEFPYHPNAKASETHPAYRELFPTLDHVVPVARGGADDAANLVTTSHLRNSAKAHWTAQELGWRLLPGGSLADWDGLTGWFRTTLSASPELRRHAAVGKWAELLERALEPD